MVRITVAVSVVAVALVVAGATLVRADDASLEFARDDKVVQRLDRAALEKGCGVRTIELDDPYYGRRMSYVACPLLRVLEMGFGMSDDQLAQKSFLLRARDGYAKPASGKHLIEPGGYLALADAEREKAGESGWAPLDRKQIDAGPFYVVWENPTTHDPNSYPWPYQLVRIEIGTVASTYPDIVPSTASKGSDAWRGFEIFTGECVACHAINGQGGKVGPDLNVPQSIVDYRPVDQIKAYIRDPQAFRYTSMPAHPDLSNAQLDQLIAYFRVMSTLKRDPGRSP
jgi:mono/diheme cytochrome c family protein